MKGIYKYKNSTIQMKLVNIAQWRKKKKKKREKRTITQYKTFLSKLRTKFLCSFLINFWRLHFGGLEKKTYKLYQFSSIFFFLTKNSKIPILLHFSLSLSFSSSLKSL